MSSSAPGKFQDHYALLGVDPKANSEKIQEAYSKLARKYHPDNPETGDQEKFDAVNLAYEVLSDAGLRAEFDKLKGIGQDDNPKFTGVGFFRALREGADLRAAVMCILYDRRRTRPFRPSVSLRHLEGMLRVTNEELNFALWYLKQRALVINDDKSSLQITADGMDFVEENPPTAEQVMPLVKPDALVEPQKAPPPPPVLVATPPPEQKTEPAADREPEPKRESVLLALSRALSREAPQDLKKTSVIQPAKRPTPANS
jgi:hypothetical protein